jgi:hypothetical protein
LKAFRRLISLGAGSPAKGPALSTSCRPRLESLEERCVPAMTFTVMNLNDMGTGSLRQAIMDANGNAGADTIVFQPGLSGTITLW